MNNTAESDMADTYHLNITAYDRPAVLERLLRVIRHRGFDVRALTVPETEAGEDAAMRKIQVTIHAHEWAVEQARPEALCLQLNKLVDVARVSFEGNKK